MKTKLTLTVEQSIVNEAKRYSKKTGISVSGLFEELFLNERNKQAKSKSGAAAGRLLKMLSDAKPLKSLDDKKLRKEHLLKKYA